MKASDYPMPHVTDSGSFFLNIWALILIGYTTFDIYNFRLHDRSKNHGYLLRTTCTRSYKDNLVTFPACA